MPGIGQHSLCPQEALEKAQSEELRKAELQNEREHRSDLEEEKEKQEKQKLLQRATRMRLEQEEEMRELTSVGPALPPSPGTA